MTVAKGFFWGLNVTIMIRAALFIMGGFVLKTKNGYIWFWISTYWQTLYEAGESSREITQSVSSSWIPNDCKILQLPDSSLLSLLLMICPTCLSRAIVLLAWSGHRPPLHGEPNIITQYRCELGHSFQTVTIFDGTFYQEHYAPFTEIMAQITVCWD